MRESDLFAPLKFWLESNGYAVHAEVNDCDIVAKKGEELVIIEMKRAINLDLLLQATERQKSHASVYVAVPLAKDEGKRWRSLNRLLKRLELGLLVVHLSGDESWVEVRFHPIEYKHQRYRHATRAILREIGQRSLNLNVGGTNKRAVMTAYREQALTVAVALERLGPCAPQALVAIGAPKKAREILYDNHYGWFDRQGKALYALTNAGREALVEYPELVGILGARLSPI